MGSNDTPNEIVELLGHDNLVQAIDAWAVDEPDEFMSIVSDTFDVDGVQEARSAEPKTILDAARDGNDLLLNVELKVTYANPIDATDTDLSAENVAEHVVGLVISDAHVISIDHSGIDSAPGGAFP